jgi:hypothetical protein
VIRRSGALQGGFLSRRRFAGSALIERPLLPNRVNYLSYCFNNPGGLVKANFVPALHNDVIAVSREEGLCDLLVALFRLDLSAWIGIRFPLVVTCSGLVTSDE